MILKHNHSPAQVWLLRLCLLIALLLAACAPAAKTPAPGETALPLEDCRLRSPEVGGGQVKARCGTLEVPEDPAAPQGRKISLNLAVVKAISRDPAPDPIFLLAGGPGQAATQAFPAMLNSLERLHFKHDLVLVDQRGTGKSNPLTCQDSTQAAVVKGQNQPDEQTLQDVEKCRAALTTDPRLYTTEVAMGDLDQVRQALGYEQINLLGVSYGTRAALTYLRLYPEHTRSLILDGVVPPNWALGASSAHDAQAALDDIFRRCQADSTCSAKFPNLAGDFKDLMAAVKNKPVEVSVADPTNGQLTRVEMNPASLGLAVRLMSYSDLTAALLPLGIHQAVQGNFTTLAGEYLLTSSSLEGSLNMGMYYSVVCAEDAPYLPEQASTVNAYLDPQLDLVRAACQRWLPGEQKAAPSQAPLKADVPVLLISGQADPVTPPANGEAVAKLLPNNLHLVIPGLGHNNFYVGCVPNLLYEFIESGSPKGIDTSCIKDIQPQPFFTSPSGPQP